MEGAIPKEETDESREGTAAHWVAQQLLQHGVLVAEGSPAPNGWLVDAEMIEGAALYVGFLYAKLGRAPGWIEQRTDGGGIHERCWGTPDAAAWDGGTLHVFDYKYGHRFVEVFENEQLLCYAADLLNPVADDSLLWVEFHVLQPRSFHRDGPTRSWLVRATDLRAYFNRLRGCAEDALRSSALTVASPVACRDCTARFRCTASMTAAIDSAGASGSPVPFDLSHAQAGRFLAYLRASKAQVEAMESGLEEQLSKAIKRGEFVPGWQLEESQSRERWLLPSDAVLEMGRAFGKNLSAKAVAVTPPQARKMGIDDSVISAYCERPRGAMNLVPIDFTRTKKVFAK